MVVLKLLMILHLVKSNYRTTTTEQLEKTAVECAKFTNIFPVLFPEENITRKMHVLSIVAPKQIKEQKLAYKMFKVEQMGESIHKTFNELERRFANQFNKSQQYYLMLREYENLLYVHI